MEEYVETYRTAVQDVQTYSTELKALNVDFYNVDSLEEYRQKRQELLEGMKKDDDFKGKADDELEAMADTFISQQNDSLSIYNAQNKQIEKMVERYGSNYEEKITDWIKSLPEEQLGILMSLDLNELDVQEVETKVQELSALGERSTIQLQVETVTNLQDKISKGEEITKEERTKAENQLGDLVNWEEFDASTSLEQINLLGEALNELNKQTLENYDNLKEAEDENKKNEEERQERIKEITEELETLNNVTPATSNEKHEVEQTKKALLNELKELENLSYDINLDINLDDTLLDIMEDKVDNIINKADQLKNVSELIGAGFIVAAEDVELLSSQFPALMQNADVLADGSVKLQKEIVGTVLNGNAAILESNKNITDQQLEDQIILLEAEIESNNSKIKLMTDYLTGKIEQTELEEGLEKEQAKLESKLINALGEEEYKNTVQAAINNAEMTSGVLSNLDKIGLRAKAVGEAIRAALAGEAVNYTAGGNEAITTTLTAFQNQNIVEEASRAGKNDEESKYIQEIERQRDELLKANEENEKLVANYKNAQSKLRSGVTDATKSMKGAAAGTGGKIDDKSGDKDKKEEKKAEDEIDRYWELNKAIEKVDESLSDLDKKQDKLYGKELIASLKEENQLLAQQADRYRELAAAQQQEAAELQGMLSAYGVVFDAQGGVANYLAASQAALERYNQAVAAYNASLIDEATFQAAERAYENFKSTLSRYEALYYQEMQDTQNKLEEIHRQELENNLKAWEVEIQLKLDTKNLERQWNEFFKKINKNFRLVYEDLGQAMEDIVKDTSTYLGENGDIAVISKAIQDVTAEIDKMKSGGQSDKFESVSQAQEKLKELNGDLLDAAEALQSNREAAWETYLDGIEQTDNQFSDLMDKFDRISDQIEYQRELIELLYGDEAYELMAEYYEAQLKNTNTQIDSLKQQADFWKEQYEIAKAIDEQNGTTSKDTQTYYEKWQKAQQGLNDSVIEYIKLLKDEYKNTINQILSDLDKAMNNGQTLNEVKNQWEILQKQAEGYYDNVEKVYQLSTLSNKYEQAIANTTSVKNQQKLQELQDKELKYLQNKKNLTEYDIELANAKYDIALKQIALEEAQNNKTAMKMTRGADGNWSYQYVADEEEVAAKQQELADAMNNYYQISKDGYQDILDNMISAQEEYQSKLREIAENTTLTEAEKKEAMRQLEEDYYGENGIITKIQDEYHYRERNLAEATLESILGYYALDAENYNLMTAEEQSLIDGLRDGTLSNYEEMLTKAEEVCAGTVAGWTSAAADIARTWYDSNGSSVKDCMQQAYTDIINANTDYQNAITALEQQVQQDFGEDGIKGAIDDAKKSTEDLEDDTEQLVKTAEEELPKYREQINLIEDAWESVKEEIIKTIGEVQSYLGVVANATSQTISLTSAINAATAAQLALNAARGDSSSNSLQSKNSYQIVQTGKSTEGQAYYSVYTANGSSVDGWLGKTLDEIYSNSAFLGAPVVKAPSFDTGGYTGEWTNGDDDGRLAWLHQKELILNAKDTQNILTAVDTVRDLSNLGNSIQSVIMDKIGQMIINLTGLNKNNSSIDFEKSSLSTTENVFNIEANFPNANDVVSIKEAIMSLPNLASQYIARNKN